MKKSQIIIILFCCFLIININYLRVTAQEIPKLKLEENFEVPIPANTNSTIALHDYIDTTLFNLSDYSLRYELFTVTQDIFSLNNISVEIIYFYNEIQFVTNTTLSSYIHSILPRGNNLKGTIHFDLSEFTNITTKKIFNINNISITLQFNVEIIEEMVTITSQINAISFFPIIIIVIALFKFRKKKL